VAKETDDVLQGFPKDGEEAKLVGEQDDPGDADPPQPELDPKDKKILELEARLDVIAKQQRQLPPAEPKVIPTPPEDTTDWDALLFSKPKEAVKKIMEDTRRATIQEMTQLYNKQEGTKRFWDAFYAHNPQFNREQDHDLVEMTLNKNLNDLANIPVAEALKKLSDLTTERIMRYAGGVKPKGKKAVVEGSAPPAPRRPAAEPARPGSIGDVIKNRRKARRGVAA